jgi:hypothetical protein
MSEEECASLAGDFPDDRGLKVKVGIDKRSRDWMFSVDRKVRSTGNSKGRGLIQLTCRQRMELFTKYEILKHSLLVKQLKIVMPVGKQ